MSHVSVLSSAAVGTLAALAGIYAGPRVPERTNLDWALAASVVASATAAGWGFLHHRLLATLVPFLLASYLAGQWRTRRAAKGRRADGVRAAGPTVCQPSSSSPSPSRGSSR